jgi:hypothetical protein
VEIKFKKMKIFLIVFFLCLASFMMAELSFSADLLYFKYDANERFRDGDYENISAKYSNKKHNFTFSLLNQRTNTKENSQIISQNYDVNVNEIWTDSVFYWVDDELVVFDTIFCDTTYTFAEMISDTLNFSETAIIQNEILLGWQYQFSKKHSAGIEAKYMFFKENNINSAYSINVNYGHKMGKLSSNSAVCATQINSSYVENNWNFIPAGYEKIEQTTTYNDTVYQFEPDSLITTMEQNGAYEYPVYESQEFEDNFQTIQFSQDLTYINNRLLLNANGHIFKTVNSALQDDDYRYFVNGNIAWYFDYFGIYGGGSTGNSFMQNNSKTLNISVDITDWSANLGTIIYPFYRNWSIAYEAKFTKYQSDYSITSHLLNIYFKL